jgi:hypothetical protein
VPDTPASPRATRLASPSWLDTRLVLGVLLVLVSVVVGARVLSAADRSTLVWAAGSDLAAGSTVDADRLQQVRVRFFDGLEDRYVPVEQDPSGLVLAQAMGSGDLLPRTALRPPQGDPDAEFRLVTVAVDAARLPASAVLQAGQVDVWLTPGDLEPAPAPSPVVDPSLIAEPPPPPGLPLSGAQLVLAGVTVETVATDAGGFGATSTTVPVVLKVRPDDVGKLVSATALGRIDLVVVPRAAQVRDLAGG